MFGSRTVGIPWTTSVGAGGPRKLKNMKQSMIGFSTRLFVSYQPSGSFSAPWVIEVPRTPLGVCRAEGHRPTRRASGRRSSGATPRVAASLPRRSRRPRRPPTCSRPSSSSRRRSARSPSSGASRRRCGGPRAPRPRPPPLISPASRPARARAPPPSPRRAPVIFVVASHAVS